MCVLLSLMCLATGVTQPEVVPGGEHLPRLHVSAPSFRADTADKPSLVELKNGKLVFKQKTLAFEKMSETMQGVCYIPDTM